jgi:hypothetical protein
MNTLTLIAIVAISGNPCASNFCRQNVAVHHANVYHAAAVYAVPYANQTSGQFYNDADVLAQAIKQGVGEALDERSIGQRPLALQGGIDLGKCTRCHGEASKNENARAAFTLANDAILDGPTAAKVLKGLRAGMAGPQYAKLSDADQQRWFDVLVETMNTHFEGE